MEVSKVLLYFFRLKSLRKSSAIVYGIKDSQKVGDEHTYDVCGDPYFFGSITLDSCLNKPGNLQQKSRMNCLSEVPIVPPREPAAQSLSQISESNLSSTFSDKNEYENTEQVHYFIPNA